MRKIHKIADKESVDGRLIVILGSAGHPEVVGIQGWCGESVVLEGEEQARAFSKRPKMENKPISLVAQTTVNRSIWNISVGLIKKRCTNLKIFDTICKATDERQSEARLLAGVSDQMIVIGDKKSSNTKRLYEISRVAVLGCALHRRRGRAYYAGARAAPAHRDHGGSIHTGMDN